AWSPDGSLIAEVTARNTLTLYRASDGTVLRSAVVAGPAGGLAFSPDGKLLAGGNGFVLRVEDLSTVADLHYTASSQDGKGMAFSPDGRYLALVDGNVDVVRTSDWAFIAQVRGQSTGVT